MKTILASLVALVLFTWSWGGGTTASASLPWAIYQESLYLSGLLAIALMSLAMVLATRPAWLERPLGGMDRVYRLHKWSGILGVSLAAAHWLVEMADDVVKALVGREGRLPEQRYSGALEGLRDLAEDMGEWAIYAVLAMLAITLWKRFPYRAWRYLHRGMPILYLTLAFHAALLAPPEYWTQPVGVLLALLLAGGVFGSMVSLAGRIGRRRQAAGTVASVSNSAAGVTEVRCRLDERWKGHRAGQFAFVTFEPAEGAHPFTIASADRGDGSVTFHIKGLGDYTRTLAQRLRVGQPVTVEGPYGRFDLSRHDPRSRQIWIAGGIGVTPFLAWLEFLQRHPEKAPQADLHYCTRDRETDDLVQRLQTLCATLPSVRLHVHGARQGELLTGENLGTQSGSAKSAEVWFCGPQGLAATLKRGLQRTGRGGLRFHQEAFELR